MTSQAVVYVQDTRVVDQNKENAYVSLSPTCLRCLIPLLLLCNIGVHWTFFSEGHDCSSKKVVKMTLSRKIRIDILLLHVSEGRLKRPFYFIFFAEVVQMKGCYSDSHLYVSYI